MKKQTLLLLFILSSTFAFGQSYKLNPTAELISGGGNPNGLFDGNTQSGWFPGWNNSDYPVKCLIDLGKETYITQIKFYDWVGKPKVEFKSFINQKLNLIAQSDCSLYGQWQGIDVKSNVKCRYVEFSILSIEGDQPVTEIEIYGSDNPQEPDKRIDLTKLSGDAKKIGINGFHWIPQDKVQFPLMRMYQVLEWTWTQQGMMFEPSFSADANYDTYLTNAKSLGYDVVFVPNKCPKWLNSTGDSRLQRSWTNPEEPMSYVEVSRYYFQLAARYGSTKHEDSELFINKNPRWFGDKVNVPKSGLNLLKYIEVENEPDRPWNIDSDKYTPEQYAALLSAAYDGHEGRLGLGCGIKTADPNMLVVMGGLSSINSAYIDRMNEWFKANRSDGKFPCDILNVHHYCNRSNSFPAPNINLWKGAGVAPERDKLDLRLKDFALYCSQNVNKPIWFSEFGYDTNKPSTDLSQYPELYGNHSSEELQSMWLVRSVLIALGSGMDATFVYNGIDENSASAGFLFGSSGLMSGEYASDGKTAFKPKQSYTELIKLMVELDGYKYYKTMTKNGVIVLEFRKKGFTFARKYFYWSPTWNDTSVKFNLNFKNLTATETVKVEKSNRIFKLFNFK